MTNNRMDRDEFFEFIKDYENQETPGTDYYLYLVQELKLAADNNDSDRFNAIQDEIDKHFGPDTWVNGG